MNSTRLSVPSIERQHWLCCAAEALKERFASAGYTMPDNVRFSIGFPKGATKRHAIGQCWSAISSHDGHYEIFVSPEITATTPEGSCRVGDVLAHEMAHVLTWGDGHGKLFKKCALAIGLTGKMTATTGTPAFNEAFTRSVVDKIGTYPAGAIDYSTRRKQGIRMLKCQCPTCGYICRTTAQWIAESGPPLCPTDLVPMDRS